MTDLAVSVIPSQGRWRSALLWGFACALSLALLLGLGTPAAHAYTGINAFTATTSTTQAGGHPDVDIHLNFNSRYWLNGNPVPPTPDPNTCDCQDVQQVAFHFPTGFIGNPHNVPQCSLALFSIEECPPEAQVGLNTNGIEGFEDNQEPLYNMEPHADQAGLLAAELPVVGGPLFIDLKGRTGGDFGLDSSVIGIYHPVAIQQINVHLWGVPASPTHEMHRFPIDNEHCPVANLPYPQPCFAAPVPSNASALPYLENPTVCGTPLTMSVDLTYYDHTVVHGDTPWPATTGCDQLSFNPSLTAKPTTTEADTASGLDIDLVVPQQQSPDVPSPSEIHASTVTLPAGMSVNPTAADGKVACTDAQANFDTEDAAQCPEYAKLGTDAIDNVSLPGPISGGMYLGSPQPGNRYRVFLTADGFATHIKLAGSIHLDPQTGQVTTTFDNLPQTPTQEVQMHFFGSERGLLATPSQCGTYPVQSSFVPWDDALPTQTSTSYFTIDSGPNGSPCPGASRPFSPQLKAGTADNTAGVYSPLDFQLTRPDGDQLLSSFSVTTPPGFSASLKGIPYCPEADIAKYYDPTYSGLADQSVPACPLASQIGTTEAGAGAGTHPLYVSGRVFLAGPYKGAPLSFLAETPGVAGPYDLGNVPVRVGLRIDPLTAQITAVTDPIPQIIGGIPLRLRLINAELNRPNFTFNPTNCDQFSIDASVSGDQGATANPSVPFQVANCTDLGFSPKLALKLSGSTKHNGHPALHATFTSNPGDVNTAGVALTLPPSMQLDNNHLRGFCTQSQFAANQCPDTSVLGNATVTTPILDQPLTGPIYLETRGEALPNLVVALKGPPSLPISIQLIGKVSSGKGGGLRSDFASPPDVPVSSLQLNLLGGQKGLIVNNTNTCKAPATAMAKITGQNGRNANQRVALSLPCGKARHKRHLTRARMVG